MNASPQTKGVAGSATVLFLTAVITLSVVGYFVGVNDGVPNFDRAPAVASLTVESLAAAPAADATPITDSNESDAMLAVSYAEMRRRQTGPTSRWKPTLESIPQPERDLFTEPKPTDAEKQASTLVRASRRAFNGAPPIIPHEIENTSDSACYACHGKGMQIDQRVANQMSHGFLANCTQCHAPPPPKPFQHVDAEVQSSFAGLPAPTEGQRAFPGAPPTIPHSTWMRQTCLSCHGTAAGWAGLESTHPWRINCQQCHAPSAQLDQAIATSEIEFLPPVDVSD